MSRILEERLNYCHAKLDEFFYGVTLNIEFKKQLEDIKRYYALTWLRAGSREQQVIELYEIFINILYQVKNNEIALEEAIICLEEKVASRKQEIFRSNFFNGLSLTLLFLLATATYLSLFTLVVPCFTISPLFGFVTLVLASKVFVEVVVPILHKCTDFELITPIEEERLRETKVISFFKPSIPSTESIIDEQSFKAFDGDRNLILNSSL